MLINKATSRGEVYCIILDHYPELVANVMRAIVVAEHGGILLHCYAGKDRTGTIVALLLRLAGVADGLIAADYAESQVRLRPYHDQLVREAGGEENLSFWSQPTVTEEMMYLLLAHLDQQYGTVENYLQRAGLMQSEITQLKNRLLREPS